MEIFTSGIVHFSFNMTLAPGKPASYALSLSLVRSIFSYDWFLSYTTSSIEWPLKLTIEFYFFLRRFWCLGYLDAVLIFILRSYETDGTEPTELRSNTSLTKFVMDLNLSCLLSFFKFTTWFLQPLYVLPVRLLCFFKTIFVFLGFFTSLSLILKLLERLSRSGLFSFTSDSIWVKMVFSSS